VSAICPYCPITDPETEIVLERDLVLSARNPKYQGALKHSGIIIPKAHRPTAFDLTEQEWLATFGLLREVKVWAGQWRARKSCMHTCM
jgi:diadenosine tetraphosphate (Ap4A) HIT family hydrolase